MQGIVLGFSGGVDSAAAALMLMREGYEVRGLFLDVGTAFAKEDAQRTAKHLNMPLETRDARENLNSCVCEPFLNGYLNGITINPCLICNPRVKLKMIMEYADEIGFENIATGHYAVVKDGGLYTGNPENDQSYQLALITQPQLKRLVLPLGSSDKKSIRRFARDASIPIADKPDSMDICFIPDHDYAKWIEKRSTVPGTGEAVFHGQTIAKHPGIHRFTVGQRWGELVNSRRLYVSGIDPVKNVVELALWEELFKTQVDVHNLNWLVPKPETPFRARIRVRHTRWEMPECTVTPQSFGVSVQTDTTLRAPAKGQIAAVYVGDRLICAGEI